MGEVESDSIDPEALEARVELPVDACTAKSVIAPFVHRVERLRRDHDAIANVRRLRAEPLADEALAAPASVRIGGVEGRDAAIPRRIHQEKRIVLGRPLAEEGRR